jgi:hypothetical protein
MTVNLVDIKNQIEDLQKLPCDFIKIDKHGTVRCSSTREDQKRVPKTIARMKTCTYDHNFRLCPEANLVSKNFDKTATLNFILSEIQSQSRKTKNITEAT